jgi:hypothetical protein
MTTEEVVVAGAVLDIDMAVDTVGIVAALRVIRFRIRYLKDKIREDLR